LIAADDLALVSALVHARAGIVLGADKAYLVESRLVSVARRFGFPELGSLVAALRRSPSEPLLRAVTAALTTNETSFFRDGRPFEQLQQRVLPQLLVARAEQRALRIWSAAASTGQEAYSIAMCLDELSAELGGWQLTIVGTDIAEAAIERARAGRYSAFEVQRGLDAERLSRHFTRVNNDWQIAARLARMVEFRHANLLEDCRALGRFDVIFLRNVLIYFDLDTRRRVLAAVRAMLADDGYLFLGGTETVLGVSDAFTAWPEGRGIVRPIGAGLVPRAPPARPAAAQPVFSSSATAGSLRIAG